MAEHVYGGLGLSQPGCDFGDGPALEKAEPDDLALVVGEPSEARDQGGHRLVLGNVSTRSAASAWELAGQAKVRGARHGKRVEFAGDIAFLPAQGLFVIFQLVECGRLQPSVKAGGAVEAQAPNGLERTDVGSLKHVICVDVAADGWIHLTGDGHAQGSVIADDKALKGVLIALRCQRDLCSFFLIVHGAYYTLEAALDASGGACPANLA